jgi:hypothetical protein
VWPLVLQVWPAYNTYAERSGRDLRVFLLEPADLPKPQAPQRAEPIA